MRGAFYQRTLSALSHCQELSHCLRSPRLICRCQAAGQSPVAFRDRHITAEQIRRLGGVPTIAKPTTEKHLTEVDHHLGALQETLGPLSTTPLVPPPAPVVVVVSGPSGVGKDAVIQTLKERRPDLYFVVTATSRAKRPGEVEGRDYFFVSKEKFESWIEQDQLLEHAVVYGEYKGIPRQQVDEALRQGTDVVLRLDVQGAATLRKLVPDAISIFIVAESEEALVRRLVSRKTESLDRLRVRVQTARAELNHAKKFDYIVVNRENMLEECVSQVAAIIDAHKLRVREAAFLH